MARARLGVATPMAEPFVLRNNAYATPTGPDEPLPTPTSAIGGGMLLMEPFIVPNFGEREGQTPRVHDVAAPLPTVTGQGAGSLVRPVANPDRPDQRQRCVCAPDRRAASNSCHQANNGTRRAVAECCQNGRGSDPRRVVLIDGHPYVLDIRFRMLKNRELARAMGFDDAESQYEFTGTATEITRQIGNAVRVQSRRSLRRSNSRPAVHRLVRRWHDGNVRSGPARPMSHATPVASVGIAA